MIPAIMFKWFYLFFIYLCVIITSSSYHVCEIWNVCAFDWNLLTWRILDHIFAWYGLTLTPVHVFLPEIYLAQRNDNYHNDVLDIETSSYNLHGTKKSKKYTRYYKTFITFFLAFLNVLLLIEIIYFSNGMIDGFPTPQLVIFGTTIVGIIIIRFGIYKLNGSISLWIIFCPKIKNPSFLLFSLVTLGIATAFFVIKEDPDGITHGEWHYFGSFTGGIFMLSLL